MADQAIDQWERKWSARARRRLGEPKSLDEEASSEDEDTVRLVIEVPVRQASPRIFTPSPRSQSLLLQRASERASRVIEAHRRSITELKREGAENLLLSPAEAMALREADLDDAAEERHAATCRCKRCYFRETWGDRQAATDGAHTIRAASTGGCSARRTLEEVREARELGGSIGGSVRTMTIGKGTPSSPTIQVFKSNPKKSAVSARGGSFRGSGKQPLHLVSLYRTKTLGRDEDEQSDMGPVERLMTERALPSPLTQTSVITIQVSDDEGDLEGDASQATLARRRIGQETRARAGEAAPTSSMLRARTLRADKDDVESEVDGEEMDRKILLKQSLASLAVRDSLDPAYHAQADMTRSIRTSRMTRSQRSTRDNLEGEELGTSAYLSTLRQSGSIVTSPAQRQLLGTAHSSSTWRRSTLDSLPSSDSKSTVRSRQRELANALRPFTRAVADEDRDNSFGVGSRDRVAYHLP